MWGLWLQSFSTRNSSLANAKIYVLLYSLLRFNLTAISKYKPPRACIWRGDLTEGFLCYEFGGLMFGGAYFRNFTVRPCASCAILSNFLVVNYYPQYLLGLHALFLTTFLEIAVSLRAGDRRFLPATMSVAPVFFYWKIEPKEIPSCLIPCLLFVFTWQLEILLTSLYLHCSWKATIKTLALSNCFLSTHAQH